MLKLVKPVSQAIPLTGDMRADADIIAFYKARQKLISRVCVYLCNVLYTNVHVHIIVYVCTYVHVYI